MEDKRKGDTEKIRLLKDLKKIRGGSKDLDAESSGSFHDRDSTSHAEGKEPSSDTKLHKMKLLLSINRKINTTLEIDELLNSIVDEAVAFTGAKRGLLLLHRNYESRISKAVLHSSERREAGFEVHVARDYRKSNLPRPIKYSSTIIKEIQRTGKSQVILDAPKDSRFKQSDTVLDLQLRTIMCVPLTASGIALKALKKDDEKQQFLQDIRSRIIGLLYVDSTDISKPFSESDLSILEALANNASIAIENAWLHHHMSSLFQEVSQSNQRLQMLYEIQKALSSSIFLDDLLKIVIDKVLIITGGERAVLLLADEDGELRFRLGKSKDSKSLSREDILISRSVIKKVLSEGEAVIANNVDQDENLKKQQSIMALQLRTIMCVPLKEPRLYYDNISESAITTSFFAQKSKPLGVLYVDSRSTTKVFTSQDLEAFNSFAAHAAISIKNAQLYSEIEDTFFDTIKAIAATIDAKDRYLHGHSDRVSKISVAIGEEMGMSRSRLKRLRMAGLLHDVGKIGIRDAVLGKPAELTPSEMDLMRQHPKIGQDILSNIKKMRDVVMGVAQHHEKVDGSGYPSRLKGEQISLEGKIIAIADTYDAITSDRPYQPALPPKVAKERINAAAGSQFDPEIIKYFNQAFDNGKILRAVESSNDE